MADPCTNAFQERYRAANREYAIAEEAARRLRARQNKPAAITTEMVVQFTKLLRGSISNGSAKFRKAYIDAVVDQVAVSRNEIVIAGRASKMRDAMLKNTENSVPSVIQKWRARKDSNL